MECYQYWVYMYNNTSYSEGNDRYFLIFNTIKLPPLLTLYGAFIPFKTYQSHVYWLLCAFIVMGCMILSSSLYSPLSCLMVKIGDEFLCNITSDRSY